jgi:hypothetical protein
MERITLAGLLKIELPGRTLLLCDGGFVPWNGETYVSQDAVFGTIASFDVPEEGVDEIIPSGSLTMNPPSGVAAVALSQPSFQGSRARIWVAEIDEATGQVVGTPDLQADWMLDRTVLRSKRSERTVDIDCVGQAQRLLSKVEGNVLSSAYHSSIFPGERGFDNGVGLEASFAWGVASAPRGVVASNTSA